MNARTLLWVALLGGVGYLLYKKIAATTVANSPQTVAYNAALAASSGDAQTLRMSAGT